MKEYRLLKAVEAKLFGRSRLRSESARHQQRRKAANVRPLVESLEDRMVPTGLLANGNFATNGGAGQLTVNTTLSSWTGGGKEGNFGSPTTPPVFVFTPGTTTQLSSTGVNGDGFMGNVKFYGATNAPDSGVVVAAMGDPDWAGSISQTVSGLTVASNYTLAFNWAGAQEQGFSGTTTEKWQVSFGSSTQNTSIVTTPSQTFAGWQTASLTFTATSTSQALTFTAVGTPSGQTPWLLLDGVTLALQSPPPLLANGDFATNGGAGQLTVNTTLASWTGGGKEGNFGSPTTPPVFVFTPGTTAQLSSTGVTGDGFMGNVSFYGATAAPDSGVVVAALGDPDWAGSISQTVSGLTVASNYTLAFNWAGAQQQGFSGDTTEKWQVSFGSSTQNTSIVSTPSFTFVGWQTASLTFTATSTSQLLTFTAVSTPSGDSPWLLLDGVTLALQPSKASPILTTTPSAPTVTLGSSAATLRDTATLVSGSGATGSITFSLYNPNNSLVDIETVSVTGNGSYTTPTGYTIPSTGAMAGTYQWDASYSGDSNNNSAVDNNATNEQVRVNPTSPSLSTAPNVTSVTLSNSGQPPLTDQAVLLNGYNQTGSITFTLHNPSGSVVLTETVSVTGNGQYTTPSAYTLPSTGTITGTYQWDASYSGDGNNSSVSDNNATNEQVSVNAATSTLSTSPNVTSVTLSTSAQPPLSDQAVVLGYHPAGSLTFTLVNPSGSVVLTETVSVTGIGQYTTPSAYTLPSTGTITGTYQWDASYSGDGNNSSISDNNATNEQVGVSAASPTLSTTPSATTVSLPSATPLRDTAALSGGYHEGGTITFALYNPSNSLVDTETVSVTGNGSYTTPSGYTLPTGGSVAGTYQWNASYSGDGNNNSASDNNSTNEQVVVSLPVPTVATTPTQSAIGNFTATLGGNVTSNGGGTLTKRGILYSTTPFTPNTGTSSSPVTEVDDPAQTTGAFSEVVNGLNPNTLYYFEAFASTVGGTAYSSSDSFTTTHTPASGISGPSKLTTGQTGTFTLLASDPVKGTQTGNFVFHIKWGDGTPTATVIGKSPASATHSYANAGTYIIQVTATDSVSNVLALGSFTVTVTAGGRPGVLPNVLPNQPNIQATSLNVAGASSPYVSAPAGGNGNAATSSSNYQSGGANVTTALGAVLAKWTSSDGVSQLLAELKMAAGSSGTAALDSFVLANENTLGSLFGKNGLI